MKKNQNRIKAYQIWDKCFGDTEIAVDFAGREIHRQDYGNRKSPFGWNLDHILPKKMGGTAKCDNLICCNIVTNEEKADKFPVFYANRVKCEIHAIKTSGKKYLRPVRI